MENKPISIRPFIGSKDFDLSRAFYSDLGFQEMVITSNFSYFHMEGLGFYLQDAYVEDWINNTMVLLEVPDVISYWEHLLSLQLTAKYPTAKLTPVRHLHWGRECFLHDPSGVLWHFSEFFKK